MKESLWVMNCEEHRKKEQRYVSISNPVLICGDSSKGEKISATAGNFRAKN
jgi:hypothetical protein